MATDPPYNPRKTYARKLTYHLKPDKCMGLLVLRFGSLGMRERERDEVRLSLRRSGCDEVLIGRMNLLKGVIRASNLPVTAHYIDQCITANSILAFAVPSCHKWASIMKAVKSLLILYKGNLMIHRFFLGHTEFPVKIFDGAIQGVCDCYNLSPKDLSLAARFRYGPSPLQDAAAAMHFHNKLHDCVLELMSNTYTCLPFELHRVIHDLIGKGHGLFICGQMDVVFHELVDRFLLEFIGKEDSVSVLDKVLEIWQVYPQFLNRSHQFFAVLDVVMHWSVVQTGYSRWITYFINAPNVSLTKRSLELVLSLRSGKSIDASVLKQINCMLMELNMYIDLFEVPYILDTTIYYQSIADTLMVCEGVDFVTVLSSMMSLELSSASYIVGDTKGKMLDLFRGILLDDTFDKLKKSLSTYAVCPFSESACVHQLSRIFGHLKGLPHGRQLLIPGIRICFDVTAPVFESEAIDLDSLIKYMDHCKVIIQGAFNNDAEILEALNESVAKVLNFTDELKEICPVRIAAYLKERIQVCSEVGTVDEEIGKVLLLVPLLENSAVCEKLLRKQLAERVWSDYPNFDFEMGIASKMEGVCSFHHVGKTKKLIEEAVYSADIFQGFRSASNLDLPEISVRVFSPYSWVSQPNLEKTCVLPMEVTEVMDSFGQSYLEHRKLEQQLEWDLPELLPQHEGDLPNLVRKLGKKIIWQTDKVKSVLKGEFDDGVLELNVSASQLCVLMLFNDSASLSFEDIRASTEIKEEKLKGTVCSLCRIGVLVETVSDGVPVYCVNTGYGDDRSDPIDLQEVEKCTSPRSPKLGYHRTAEVTRVLVGLMCRDKTIRHKDLAEQALDKLLVGFDISPIEVEDRIRYLLTKGYMIPDKDDRLVYHYVPAED